MSKDKEWTIILLDAEEKKAFEVIAKEHGFYEGDQGIISALIKAVASGELRIVRSQDIEMKNYRIEKLIEHIKVELEDFC